MAAEHAECKTIYMSPELRQAHDNEGRRETPIPEVRHHSSHRLNYMQSHDRVLRRSFGSTDLLHNAHPSSYIALASDSADSLEGAVPLHADWSGKHSRADKRQSDADVTPKSREGSKVSLDDPELPAAGEGKSSSSSSSSSKKAKATAQLIEDEDDVEGEEERWVDASDVGESTEEGRDEKEEEDDGDEEEEEEKDAVPLLAPHAGKKHHSTILEDSRYLQDFHSLPKNLVPSEITHCLYMLEEECRGVERESENVKWKMEFIHGSMQCVQETLRTLLIRLVEAQNSNNHLRDATSNPATPPLPVHQRPSSYASAVDAADPSHCGPHSSGPAHQHHHHHHHHHHHANCKAPHPVPSKTCLMDGLNPDQCCQGALPADTPSCAQRAKERAAAFNAITELRADVERLRMAHLEERREQQEALRVLKNFQRQVEDLIQAQRGHSDKEGSSETLSCQLLQLKQEVQEVADMTRQAMTVLQKLGIQLEIMGVETHPKQSDKCDK